MKGIYCSTWTELAQIIIIIIIIIIIAKILKFYLVFALKF